MTALNDILEINAFRHSISRPPLHISVGLASGVYTPEFYMLNENSGYTVPLSLPFNLPVGGGSTTPACGLEPQPWLSSFTSAYESAYSELLSFVHDTMTTGISPASRQSRITLVKVTPMNATSLELFLPGLSTELSTALEDPGASGHSTETDDVPIDCPLTPTGANVLLTNYSHTGLSGYTLIQALEQTLGTSVGYLYATLQNLDENQAYLSIATTNGAAYPQIRCDDDQGDSPCGAQNHTADQWSTYWFVYQINDLFVSGSIAQTAATNAASGVSPPVTFSLSASGLYVNTTDLEDPDPPCTDFPTSNDCQAASQGSLSCDLNETVSGDTSEQGVFELYGTPDYVYTVGAGTSLGVQTMDGLDGSPDYCSSGASPSLSQILNFAIQNGAQFIELTPDIAFDSTCQSAYASILADFPNTTYTNCQY